MLVIRLAQLQAMEAALHEEFVQRLTSAAASRPESTHRARTMVALREFVLRQVDRARGCGFSTERELALFTFLALEHGEGFEQSSALPFRRVVFDPRHDAATRAAQLEFENRRLQRGQTLASTMVASGSP